MYIRNAPPVFDVREDASSLLIEKSVYAQHNKALYRKRAGVRTITLLTFLGIFAIFEASIRMGWEALIGNNTLQYTAWMMLSPLWILVLIDIYFNNARKISAWHFHLLRLNPIIQSHPTCKRFSSKTDDIDGKCKLFSGETSPPSDVIKSQSLHIQNKLGEGVSDLDFQDSFMEAHDISEKITKAIPEIDYYNSFIHRHSPQQVTDLDAPDSMTMQIPHRFNLPLSHTPLSLFIALGYCTFTLILSSISAGLIYKTVSDIELFFSLYSRVSLLNPLIVIITAALLLIPALIFSIKAAYFGLFPFFGNRTLTIHPDGVEFTERGLRKIRQHHRVSFDDITDIFVNKGKLGEALYMFGDTHLVVRWDKASFAVLGDGMSLEELHELHVTIEQACHACLQDRPLARPA